MGHRRTKPPKWSYRLTGVVMVVFMLVSVLVFYLVQKVLLENAQNLGNELASRYAQMELEHVHTAERFLMLGAWDVEGQVEAGATTEDLEAWMQRFTFNVNQAVGSGLVPFGVVNGIWVAGDGGEAWLEDGPPTQQSWYQQAMETDGQSPILSTCQPVQGGVNPIIVAQRCGETAVVLAFQVTLGEEEMGQGAGTLPAGSSYYLCDAQGNLLYAKTQLQVEPEELQPYIYTLFQQIKAGQLDDAQEYIYDLVAEKRAVFFHTQEDGGVSIITIPYSALFGDLRQAFDLVIGICVAVFLVLVFLGVREHRLQQRLSRENETVAALGNLYYSIYRVNWDTGTYEAIKRAQDLTPYIPIRGKYEDLLQVIGQYIDQETFDQFKSSFSLERMRDLVEHKVSDYGGEFRRRFGTEYRWVNVRLLFDDSLQRNEAVLCFRQVDEEKTQRLQQLEMLEHALDQAKESEEAKTQFFSQMSHDMRTPLNVILGTVELAQRRQAEGADTRGEWNQVQLAARQMLELINDILEISRMERTDLHLKNDPCDLTDTVGQCLAAFQSQADLQHKHLEVTLDLIHPKVYVDGFRLQQVLNNLVSNALKFTREGDRIQVEVSQSQQKNREMCRIVVADTGIGMSEEFLPHLFTPYAREARFGVQTVLGTGLGMVIVQTIVHGMQGEIQVESAPGKGTTVVLTIPMEPVAEAAEPEPEQSAEDPTAYLAGKRVLLAEDYEMNLDIATQLLGLCGAQVTQARNGQEAVEAFCASQPGWFDVILMDMNMPVMDGCAAASAIRALEREDAATVPILALTANAFAEDVAATARAGMNAHVAKPIDMRQLATVLRQISQ